MSPNRDCATCQAFFRSEEGQTFCRKGPPTASVLVVQQQDHLGRVVPAMQTVATWPPIKEGQWCLAWTPKLAMLQ